MNAFKRQDVNNDQDIIKALQTRTSVCLQSFPFGSKRICAKSLIFSTTFIKSGKNTILRNFFKLLLAFDSKPTIIQKNAQNSYFKNSPRLLSLEKSEGFGNCNKIFRARRFNRFILTSKMSSCSLLSVGNYEIFKNMNI